MCAQFDPVDSRDRAIARAVARAVRSSQTDEVCPDASLIAAYADQALADSDRAHLENHFAGCERCQQTLAALGVVLEAAAGERVAVMPAPVAARPQPAQPKRWLWWLSPAFGAAAAGLLWMVLRPAAPAPVETAANYSAEEPRTRSAPTAPSAESEPPASAIASRRDAQTLDRMSKAATEAKEVAADTQQSALAAPSAPSADAIPHTPPSQPAVRAEIATAAAPLPVAPPVSNVPAPVSQGNAVGRLAPGAAVAEQSAAVSAYSPPAGQAIGNLAMTARAAAQRTIYTYTFASPEGGAQWRLGPAGLIEKSTDNGQTWQQQPSGVTVDLLAGSAASNEVAWVVGRAGLILRTTNGQQWQRIAAPAGITDDWATVVVRSATSATIVGPIRRFSTEDGGMTWTEQK